MTRVDALNLNQIDFNDIPIDSNWNMPSLKEKKIHNIHSYPAKFPAFITTKAIELSESRGINVNDVADIFCGCGTVAFESVSNGKQFWGYDINPVATLIARAKSSQYNYETIITLNNQILEEYRSATLSTLLKTQVNSRILYWFDPMQIERLLTLKECINRVPMRTEYRDFFLCAFSNILKPCSRWLTKSIKPQIDPNKKPKSPFEAFCMQTSSMIKAIAEIKLFTYGQAHIKTQNILKEEFQVPFVDLLVTSPPYVTSYEYADLHQLSTLWLGYSEDYRAFRKGSIGSLHTSTDYSINKDKLNKTGLEIVSQLLTRDKSKAKSSAQYYVDMQAAVKKSHEMLNIGGAALFVIGNTEYKGVHMNNAKHLVESLINQGFNSVEVARRKISSKILTPYRDQNGRFSKSSVGCRKIYSEEFVVFVIK